MSAVAPAAALSMELLLSSQQRQQLTPLQYAGLQTALRSVLAASTKQATATLLLCIALESAAQLLLDTGGVQARQTAVTQLLHWLDKERPAIRARTGRCWTDVAKLLTTEANRAYWTAKALDSQLTLSFAVLHELQSHLSSLYVLVAAGRLTSVNAFFDEMLALEPPPTRNDIARRVERSLQDLALGSLSHTMQWCVARSLIQSLLYSFSGSVLACCCSFSSRSFSRRQTSEPPQV